MIRHDTVTCALDLDARGSALVRPGDHLFTVGPELGAEAVGGGPG